MIHWIELAVLLPLALIVAYAMGRMHGMRAADRIHKKYAMPEPTRPAPPMPIVQQSKPAVSKEEKEQRAYEIIDILAQNGNQHAIAIMKRRRDDNRSHQEPSEPWN